MQKSDARRRIEVGSPSDSQNVLAADRFRSTTADDDNRLLVQSFIHTRVSTVSLSRSRFAVGPYLDYAVFLTDAAAFTATNRGKRTILSSSFSLLHSDDHTIH